MNIKKTVLKNGLRIMTIPMKDTPTVTVQVWVAAGTRYETKKTNGISHFLEHMCFKGTTRRTALEIAYELEAMGAQSNAFTNYDMTGYYAKGRAVLFPKLLDIVADVYLNSIFPKEEIEKEKGVVCGEIDMINDNPQHKINYTFLESIYGDQPAGYSIAGPKDNIRQFSRKDFIDYHKKHYHAEKTVVVVAGNINEKEVIELVKKAFATIASKPVIVKKKIVKKPG
ncbi:MAG TPA: pitrilysin family protein, partial [Candidatus Paceibacterota bacterium]|nr:pitrilysin family protein [Candidatus Paceibacterota bacterium]